MVLGLVSGSMPMLVSLLLMQGITLTMWRSFLDKTIPQYDSEKWRKSLEQVVRGGVAGGGGDTASATASTTTTTDSQQHPSTTRLEPSPHTALSSSTFDQPQADPVTNSLQILANMDPKLIQLLGQLQNQNGDAMGLAGSGSATTTTTSPLTAAAAAAEQLKLLNSLASLMRSLPNQGDQGGTIPSLTELLDSSSDLKDPNHHLLQQSPPSSYLQYTHIDPSDPIKYYEVSSDHLKFDPDSMRSKDPVDGDFGSQKYQLEEPVSDPEAEELPEDSDDAQQPEQPKKPIPKPVKDLYEEVDYDNEDDGQNQDELDGQEEDEEEEEGGDDYDQDQDQDGPEHAHRPKITIRERINPGKIFAASKNRMKFLKPNVLVKTSSMFGKPRIQKRMLRFESGPFQYAQTKLKRKFLNSIRSMPFLRRNSKKKIRPAYEPSWKRTGNPSKGNFRFVTPTAPILLPVGSNRNEDGESKQSSLKQHQPKSSKPAAKNTGYKKSLKLKSNKITLTDIEETTIQDDCIEPISIPKSKNGKPFKEIWSQKKGWNKCHPKSPNFRLAKGIIVPNIVDTSFNLSLTTLEPLGITDEAEIKTDSPITKPSAEQQTTTTPASTMVTTVAITESPITTTSTTTPTSTVATPVTDLPKTDLFVIDFNNLLMTLTTTTSPMLNVPTTTTTTTTTTVSPLTMTTDHRTYMDELPREFLAHVLKAIDHSKIDNFQANRVNGQEHPDHPQPTTVVAQEDNDNEENGEDLDSEEEEEDLNHHQIKNDNRVDGKMLVAHSFKRVCYYLLNGGKDGRLDINQLELHICSHLIVGYARISTNGLVVTQRPLEDTEKYQQLTLMKLQYPQLKILLSIGDRGGTMFSIVASNNRTRDRFIMSIMDFCDEFNFDGVDIDWEFPGFHTPGSFRDRENLILLLKELRQRSDKFWKRKKRMKVRGDSFLITLAVGAPLIIASTSYTIPDIGKYVDFVNLMSYDFHYYRPDKPYTGHHSPLYPRSTDSAYFSTLNVAWTATYWANSGMPLEKIIVGVPTYARTYNLVVPIGQNMINVPASGPGIGKGKLNYTLVCQFLKLPGTIKQYDSHSQVPYAYKDFDWIAYENEMSVAIKAQWVIKTGMGGMVTFALNFDDSKGTCREDGKKFPLQKTISNLLELASIKSYRQSLHFTRVVSG